MTTLAGLVLLLHVVLLAGLGVLAMHRWALAWASRRPPVPPPTADARWRPVVTVQLPLFDERDVAARAVAAAGALDWPRDRLEIQVLDDSTDDTRERVDAAVARLVADGVDAVVLRRDVRTGFKAGALAEGLAVARGEVVAVFDADFVPAPDTLRRLVPFLAPADVGMVQARWGHLNADEDWLTATQATMLDGHFVLEHGGRWRLGAFFNFNGTAGVWRAQAIHDAGGWSHDTLTEDMDLSYRSQLAGWRFVYRDDVVVPAELPPTLRAFKAQQARWARGGTQTMRKLLGRLLAAPLPLVVKREAASHLLANVGYPATLALALVLPLLPWARARASWSVPW
ncbi:MAG: glycosyltransferase, partial [Myxococcales bacterium]|nr:glycosyltransferase [Myxococcales bacterium]